jgi:hypothetical protein
VRVEVGTRFRAPYEATKVTWEIYRKTADGRWLARIEDDEIAGDIGTFTTRQIEQHLGYEQELRRAQIDHEKFYRSLPIGKIVHYHDGHNRFVRCEVTSDRKLKAIALVGNWRPDELPHNRTDGSRIVPFHSQRVLRGDVFEPRAHTVYEALYEAYEHDDPALMDPRGLPDLKLQI